uniref:F-box domain-containing protein n=1 Tax=Setaria italica TaxID=4555 RepID=K3YYB6_SETIT
MGAGSSILGADGEWGETSLGDMPESCVAAVLLYLDPPEICQVARLNRAFRGAASADCVWAVKLPANYRYLAALAAAADDEVRGDGDDNDKRFFLAATKKEIYARLCRPTLFDAGRKANQRKCGSKLMFTRCYKFGLLIDCTCCSWDGLIMSSFYSFSYVVSFWYCRFHSVAYLQQIWWLEVDGELEFCFPAGSYSLFFHLHLGRPYRRMGRRLCATEHMHGWDVTPTRFQLSTSDEQQVTSEYYLHLHEQGGWKLYHVGDFVVSNPDEPMKLKFSMMQIDCTHTKGGLCVDSVFIYPKGYKPERANIVCM